MDSKSNLPYGQFAIGEFSYNERTPPDYKKVKFKTCASCLMDLDGFIIGGDINGDEYGAVIRQGNDSSDPKANLFFIPHNWYLKID